MAFDEELKKFLCEECDYRCPADNADEILYCPNCGEPIPEIQQG